MVQSERDVFRLVSVRRPDSSRTTDPVEHVRNSDVTDVKDLGARLAANDWRIGDAAATVAALPSPRTVPSLRADVPWFKLAESFAAGTSKGAPADLTVKIGGGQDMSLAEYARTGEFARETDDLARSWLILEINARLGRPVAEEATKAYRTALKFAALMRHLASRGERDDSAVDAFARPLVVPPSWRTRSPRAPSKVAAPAAASAVASLITRNIDVPVVADGPVRWRTQHQDFSSEAAALQRVRVKATLMRDAKTVKGVFSKDLAAALEKSLSAEERVAFTGLLNGGTLGSGWAGLIHDLEVAEEAKLVTANALCRRIRVYDEEQTESLPDPKKPRPGPHPAIRAVGWGDLLVIREQLVGYEAGEISHIENTLAGESFSREFDRRHRTQVLFEDESTTTTSTENHSVTTDRFELQSAADDTISKHFAVQGGVNTSGKYGLTQVDTSLSGQMSRTSTTADHSASQTAHEVIATTVNSTQEVVRSLRRTLSTDSIRELTTHAIDNTKGAAPTSRTEIYRWVNKRLRLQMYHYGKRLLIEFTIPEPGLSLIEAVQPVRSGTPKPRPLAVGPADISEANYLCLTDLYDARDVPPPPPLLMQVGKAFVAEQNFDLYQLEAAAAQGEELVIPVGYRPISGRYSCTGRGHTAEKEASNAGLVDIDAIHVHLAVGGEVILDSVDPADPSKHGEPSYAGTFVLTSTAVTDDKGVPITVRWSGADDNIATMNVYLTCQRGREALDAWRLDVYQHLLDAHARLESVYQEAVRMSEFNQSADTQAFGYRPPEQNRTLERTELKKWAIKLLRAEPFDIGAVAGQDGLQEIDPVAADEWAPVVRFFEETFEWDQMTYFLAPYFWGRRKTWALRQNLTVPNDPRHEAFLRAGSARVFIPVMAGQEGRVLSYLETAANSPDLLEWDPAADLTKWDPNAPSQRIPPTDLDVNDLDPHGVLERSFPELWLEIIEEFKPDTLRGSGRTRVAANNPKVTLVDSVETLDKRDIGREIFIDAGRYQIESVQSTKNFTLDRDYEGVAGDLVYAIGAQPRGAPWEIRIPTNLLALSANAGNLNAIP